MKIFLATSMERSFVEIGDKANTKNILLSYFRLRDIKDSDPKLLENFINEELNHDNKDQRTF